MNKKDEENKQRLDLVTNKNYRLKSENQRFLEEKNG